MSPLFPFANAKGGFFRPFSGCQIWLVELQSIWFEGVRVLWGKKTRPNTANASVQLNLLFSTLNHCRQDLNISLGVRAFVFPASVLKFILAISSSICHGFCTLNQKQTLTHSHITPSPPLPSPPLPPLSLSLSLLKNTNLKDWNLRAKMRWGLRGMTRLYSNSTCGNGAVVAMNRVADRLSSRPGTNACTLAISVDRVTCQAWSSLLESCHLGDQRRIMLWL